MGRDRAWMKAYSSENWQFSGSPPQISGVDVLPPPPSFLPPPSSFKTVHFDARLTAEQETGQEQFIPMEVTYSSLISLMTTLNKPHTYLDYGILQHITACHK